MSHRSFDTIRQVGQYEVVDLVARGGMAVVYRARQPALSRVAALKRLNLESDDPRVLERFMRESRVAAALEHPNIVTVFDFFEHEGVPYIAMEYLSRGSLRPWIGRLTQPQVFGALEGLLAGLAHAQEHCLAHRDLKPENVLLTRRGAVKIADFGIARAYTNATARLTATGMAMGTPAYMAPEQATGAEVGPGTDLYALGVMAFEMLSGRTPFTANTGDAMGVLYRHVHKVPPALSELDPAIDGRVSSWVAGMLEKDPANRPRNAVEAWQALEEVVVDLHGSYWRRDAPIGTLAVSSETLPDDVSVWDLHRVAEPCDRDAGTRAPVKPPDVPRVDSIAHMTGGGPPARLYIAAPDTTLEVRDDGTGAVLHHVGRWRRPRVRRRRDRLHPRPPRFENHIDRAGEIDALTRAQQQHRAINVYGDRAIGKTHVLVEALYRFRETPRDGVVYLDGRGQSADDLHHALFEELYLCAMPVRDPRISRHLRARCATVAVEDVSLSADEVRRLIDGAPRCRFIFTSRERVLWDGPAVRVGALAPQHASAFAEQEMGRALSADERAAAAAIAKALDGHPLRLRQAFSRAGGNGASLVALQEDLSSPPVLQERLASLSAPERRVARALAVYGGASVGTEHIRALMDEPDTEPAIENLRRRHDVAAEGGRYRLVGVLAHALPLSDDLATETGEAIAHFTAWLQGQATDPDAVLDDMPAVLALIERAFLAGDSPEAIQLGRAAEGWLAARHRWAAWGLVLAIVLACARDLGDGVTEGWALNQLGTRSVGLGRSGEAQRMFQKALEVRERAGDHAGAAATRHNLRILECPPPLLPRATHRPAALVGIAALTIAVFVIGPGLIGHTGDDTPAAASAPARLTIKFAGRGTGVVRTAVVKRPCRAPRCELRGPAGSAITLTAVPARGSHFAGWRGAGCAEKRRCRIRLTRDRTITARFTKRRPRIALAVTIDGTGTVIGAGRRCSSHCRFELPRGRRLRLVARAGERATFAGWSGDCHGQSSCSLVLDGRRSVTAHFDSAPPPTPPPSRAAIHLQRAGDGTGTVALSTGERCRGDCVIDVPRGRPLTITPEPGSHSSFAGWTGACAGTRPCTFTPDVDTTVGARFTRHRVRLTVDRTGDGRGTLSVDGHADSCLRGCTLRAGARVTVRAGYDERSTTVRWSRAECHGSVCRFSLVRDTAVTVRFDTKRFVLRLKSDGPGTIKACGGSSSCSRTYDYGQPVSLTARPADGTFERWDGCRPRLRTRCEVRMTRDRSVTAHFAERPVTLTVATAGDAAGQVTVDGRPDGCSAGCRFRKGDRVVLHALYDSRSTAVSWEGANCSGGDCSFPIDRNTTVRATFTIKRFTLDVLIDGDGAVEISPPNTTCDGPARCSQTYEYGTEVTLAAHGQDDLFANWDGCGPERDGTCVLTVTGDRTVTAHFRPRPVTLTVLTIGSGSVSVDGVSCEYGCTFDRGTRVTLDATYDPKTTTVSWTGLGVDCSDPTCHVVMWQDTTVTATFSSVIIVD